MLAVLGCRMPIRLRRSYHKHATHSRILRGWLLSGLTPVAIRFIHRLVLKWGAQSSTSASVSESLSSRFTTILFVLRVFSAFSYCTVCDIHPPYSPICKSQPSLFVSRHVHVIFNNLVGGRSTEDQVSFFTARKFATVSEQTSTIKAGGWELILAR